MQPCCICVRFSVSQWNFGTYSTCVPRYYELVFYLMLAQTVKIIYLGWVMNEMQVFIYKNITIFLGKPKYLENELSKQHFVHNKSHLDFPFFLMCSYWLLAKGTWRSPHQHISKAGWTFLVWVLAILATVCHRVSSPAFMICGVFILVFIMRSSNPYKVDTYRILNLSLGCEV
jgi:hypothetical protein